MNWKRKSSCVMTGENGYQVAKYLIAETPRYRASRGGKFLGSPQDTFEEATSVCENHLAIMGSEEWEDE